MKDLTSPPRLEGETETADRHEEGPGLKAQGVPVKECLSNWIIINHCTTGWHFLPISPKL